jgi:hypothetical protein
MAILKIDPTARFKLISQYDDAVIEETKEELDALKFFDEQGAERMKPTRYQEYIENLDESKLKLDPTKTPDRFVFRCLTNGEQIAIQEKYAKVDVIQKKTDITSINAMFLEIFNTAILGVETGGKMEKITAENVGLPVAISIGSVISLFTSLGKHLKK